MEYDLRIPDADRLFTEFDEADAALAELQATSYAANAWPTPRLRRAMQETERALREARA